MRITASKVVEALNQTASGNGAATVLDGDGGLDRAVPERRR